MTRAVYVVTGGAGFIGSTLVRKLLATGATVAVIDMFTYAGRRENLEGCKGDLRVFRSDVCNGNNVGLILQACRPLAVFHLAAETHVDRSIDDAWPFLKTNVEGTMSMLQHSLSLWRTYEGKDRDRFRFVQVSTDEVYGSLDKCSPASCESDRYKPRSPYAATKASGDHLASAYHETYGLPTIVTNCTNNYGPRQFPEKLIPLMILNALYGEKLPVYGDGNQIRDWLHVEDHCEALMLVAMAGKPGETYHIGAGCQRTNIHVVQTICECMQRAAPRSRRSYYKELIRHVQDRPGHDRRYALVSNKIRQELGWSDKIQLEDGLAATVDWYLANRAWWEPLVEARVRRGLGG